MMTHRSNIHIYRTLRGQMVHVDTVYDYLTEAVRHYADTYLHDDIDGTVVHFVDANTGAILGARRVKRGAPVLVVA